MRFTGWIFTGGGAVGGLILFFLRRTAWFAAEQAKSMSEAEEFVTSAFWACVLMLLVGVFLLIRSVARKTEQYEQPAAEEPELWVCQCCGTENEYEDQVCRYCGMPYGSTPRSRQAYGGGDWVCPCCGRVLPENAAVCLNCGYDRFADTNQNFR